MNAIFDGLTFFRLRPFRADRVADDSRSSSETAGMPTRAASWLTAEPPRKAWIVSSITLRAIEIGCAMFRTRVTAPASHCMPLSLNLILEYLLPEI